MPLQKCLSTLNNLAASINDTRMYSLKELSTDTGFHKNNILNYNAKQLISLRLVKGKLVCSAKDRLKLQCAKVLSQEYGINIAGIRYILAMFDELQSKESILNMITHYAEKANMSDTYKHSRLEVYENKYKKEA